MSFCDNYIQLVWAVTSYVGCSLYDQAGCGGSGKIITCYYAMGANLTETPYTTGAASSGCTGSWADCENDLCIRTICCCYSQNDVVVTDSIFVGYNASFNVTLFIHYTLQYFVVRKLFLYHLFISLSLNYHIHHSNL